MYRYGSAAKQFTFRSDSPLSNAQIMQYAPSVMAAEAHASRGDRYAFIPTMTVLDGLRDNGFQPFEVRQTKCRDASKREFTRHMVRMRHADVIGSNGKEVPEIVLLNSHDGSSSYQLLAGIFRFICSNGLIAGDICDDIRIRHSGRIVDDVIEGSFTVLDNLQEVTSRIETYKGITLSNAEQLALADSAMELRWGSNAEGTSLAPIYSQDQLLSARRYDDRKSDLWTTFNRLQENVIKGGLRGKSASNRRTRTREVGGVNETVKLNKALWMLTDQMARIKLGEGVANEPAVLLAA